MQQTIQQCFCYIFNDRTSDIHIEEVYIINKFGQKQTVSDPEVLITTSPELNGKVTVHSVLPDNSLSVRYIVVSITNKDGITKKLVIEQYPLEYVTNTQGGIRIGMILKALNIRNQLLF